MNIFGFRTVAQQLLILHVGPWENVMVIFHHFLTFYRLNV